MLTKQAAIERLRTTGTLATGPRPRNLLTKAQASTPAARALANAATQAAQDQGQRALAPAASHAVLP